MLVIQAIYKEGDGTYTLVGIRPPWLFTVGALETSEILWHDG